MYREIRQYKIINRKSGRVIIASTNTPMSPKEFLDFLKKSTTSILLYVVDSK